VIVKIEVSHIDSFTARTGQEADLNATTSCKDGAPDEQAFHIRMLAAHLFTMIRTPLDESVVNTQEVSYCDLTALPSIRLM
jgi:hypothetical protein